MPVSYSMPGVYVIEESRGPRPIEAVGTSTAAFVGRAPVSEAFRGEVVAITNFSEFEGKYCRPDPTGTATQPSLSPTFLSSAVFGFFLNGGKRCYILNIGAAPLTQSAQLDALRRYDDISIVCAPGQCTTEAWAALTDHCQAEAQRDRVAILDGPNGDLPPVSSPAGAEENDSPAHSAALSLPNSSYAAIYWPWIKVWDPLQGPDATSSIDVPPSGHIAGIWARTDALRGVHKAPANETVRGAVALALTPTSVDSGVAYQRGINFIRSFSREGIVVWGARTLDTTAEWKYVNVRRLFNMIEESIARGTRWVVFEPNDQTLWKSIRRDIGAFLTQLWREGALMGKTAEEAFFVKCDEETNPQDEIDLGRVTTVIGIAPVKPAEFVIFKIGQHASGAEAQQIGGRNAG